MKPILLLIAALMLSTGAAQATEAKKELTASQQRMVDCNKEAAGKKGDERKTFMSTCMKADKPPATQQNRMKDCNLKAGDMKGDARKAFMSECLKNK